MIVIAVIIIGLLAFGTKKGRSIVGKVIKFLMKSILKYVLFIALGVLAVYIVYWMITHVVATLIIAACLITFGIFGALLSYIADRIRFNGKLEEWQNIPVNNMTDSDIYNVLSQFAQTLAEADSNSKKFPSDIPYGRVTYFLNFFEHDLNNEEPIYYSAVRSKNNDEIREFGFAFTTAGIYISSQTNKKDKNKQYTAEDYYIPFAGIAGVHATNSYVTVYYPEFKNKVKVYQSSTTIPVKEIGKICEYVRNSGISKAIYSGTVYDYESILDEKESEFLLKNEVSGYQKGFEATGVASSLPQMNQVFNEIGNNMNQRQGHGAAAEYANTALDRARGIRVEHIGGDNAKDGADRITKTIFGNKEIIQCKYCKNATDTINDGFFKHKYPNNMKREVPRNQFRDCVSKLQKKIDNGELEDQGIHKGDKAEKYLKKGLVTYDQSLSIAKAGTVEGLAVDAVQGVICSVGSGSITAFITFAFCKWNGMDTKDAALNSLQSFAKVVGRGTAIFVVTMQLSRKNMYSYITKTTFENPVFKLSENVAGKINKSSLAKSNIGQKVGLNKVTGKVVISSAITVGITFGPDICRALMGRISAQQLIKNSSIGASGLAGAAIGQAIIPIPIVGGVIGGAVAGFVAKKALDKFIEDDAIEMFAILKEEFMDVIPLAGLTKDEFDKVVSLTVAHKELPHILRDMYAYGDSREYAKENIISVAIQEVYSKREKITETMYLESMAMAVAN